MALRFVKHFSHGVVQARVYRDVEWDEYRVKLYINGVYEETADYHTDDKHDAIQTADVMAMNANIRKMQS